MFGIKPYFPPCDSREEKNKQVDLDNNFIPSHVVVTLQLIKVVVWLGFRVSVRIKVKNRVSVTCR